MFSPALSLANLDCKVCIAVSTCVFFDVLNLLLLIKSISLFASASFELA